MKPFVYFLDLASYMNIDIRYDIFAIAVAGIDVF